MSNKNPTETFDIQAALRRAQAHLIAGEVVHAERVCSQIVATYPDELQALRLLGTVANARSDEARQGKQARASLAAKAGAVERTGQVEAYLRNRQLAEAEAAARQWVAVAPRVVSSWNTLGLVLKDSGKLEESREAFERAVALKPDHAEGHNNLGNVLRELGLMSSASWHYIQAIAADQNFAEAYSNISLFHISQGEYEQAVTAARRAIELKPQLVEAYLNLAEGEILRQRYDLALGALDALNAIAPEHMNGRVARNKLLEQLDCWEDTLWENYSVL